MGGADAGLPDFPAHGDSAGVAVPASDLHLRPATGGDLPFLRELYASTRSAELAAVPWPDAVRTAFLSDQFALQHRHWLSCHPKAEYWVVERQNLPVGRCYVDFGCDGSDDDALLIDLSLLPEARGQGIGSALLGHLLRRCDQRGQAMRLHVLHTNADAQRLYRRHGFVTEADHGAHLCLRRRGSPALRQLNSA